METLAAILGGGGLAAVTTFGLLAFFAQRSKGDEQALRVAAEKDNETLKASNTERAAALVEAKETIRALNVALADFAAQSVGPVSGAHARLFQAVADANRRSGGDQIVSAAGATSNSAPGVHQGDDGLLAPGE